MQEFFDFNSAKISWFRCGGTIKHFCIVDNLQELQILIEEHKNEKKVFVGAGSNILFRDGFFDGLVIKLGKGFNNIVIDNNNVLTAGSAVFAKQVANFAIKNNLIGAEFLHTIPGSIGGVLKMNAGCFGVEVKDIFSSAEILLNDKIKTFTDSDIIFEYRHTNIPDDATILNVSFKLNYGNEYDIKSSITKMTEMDEYRKQNQIIGFTCGSTFKNHIDKDGNKISVWKLIDGVNLRGFQIGGAKVSEKHCNFIVNTGNATATDIEQLINVIKETVLQKYGIKLLLEIKIV